MTVKLSEAHTALWESDDAIERETFRRNVRDLWQYGPVEIHSADGIVLDAWEGSAV